MDERSVLLVIASTGFQRIEYQTPKNILQHAGFIVVTASDKSGTAIASDQTTEPVDITLDKLSINNYSGIFFIGGPGALEHLDNHISYKIIQEAAYQNKPIGAICIATRILAHANVLHGRQATGWNEDGLLNAIYAECHARFLSEDSVVVDANIITATDPSAAHEFGEQIIQLLHNKQTWG